MAKGFSMNLVPKGHGVTIAEYGGWILNWIVVLGLCGIPFIKQSPLISASQISADTPSRNDFAMPMRVHHQRVGMQSLEHASNECFLKSKLLSLFQIILLAAL